MNNIIENQNRYKSEIKVQVSSKLMEAVIESCEDINNVAALTSTTFTGTDLLKSKLGRDFFLDAIECDPNKDIQAEFNKQAKLRGAETYTCMASEYINKSNRVVDFLYLDYMCSWSNVQQDIFDAHDKGVISPNGVIAFTVSQRSDVRLLNKYDLTSWKHKFFRELFLESRTSYAIDLEMKELGYERIFHSAYKNKTAMLTVAYRKLDRD